MSDYTDQVSLFDRMGRPRTEAQERRDAGIQSVDANSKPFTDLVCDVVRGLPFGSEWTGEDIRTRCEELEVTPHHPNAWGAAITKCVRQGLLAKTGEYRQMRRAKSNARETRVYRRVMP